MRGDIIDSVVQKRRVAILRALLLLAATCVTGCREESEVATESPPLVYEPLPDDSPLVYVSGIPSMWSDFGVGHLLEDENVEFGRFRVRGPTGGRADIRITPPYSWQLVLSLRERGAKFIEIPVALDAAAVIVHRDNDWVDRLTLSQLRELYNSDKRMTWRELDPRWPDRIIKIFVAHDFPAGTSFVYRMIAGLKDRWNPNSWSTGGDDGSENSVANNSDAIAVILSSYVTGRVRSVPVSRTEQEPPELVAPHTYSPFLRPILMYVSLESTRRPAVLSLVSRYLESLELLGYLPIDEAVAERARAHFENRWTGTHFLTESGEARRGKLADIYTKSNLVE